MDKPTLERETRFELATPTLARLCSTTELFPLGQCRQSRHHTPGCAYWSPSLRSSGSPPPVAPPAAGRLAARMTAEGGLRRPAPSFSSLLGNPEDERYSLSHAWVKNGDKAKRVQEYKSTRGREHKIWIPDPPVITAEGCDNWGVENDGVWGKSSHRVT